MLDLCFNLFPKFISISCEWERNLKVKLLLCLDLSVLLCPAAFAIWDLVHKHPVHTFTIIIALIYIWYVSHVFYIHQCFPFISRLWFYLFYCFENVKFPPKFYSFYLLVYTEYNIGIIMAFSYTHIDPLLHYWLLFYPSLVSCVYSITLVLPWL